MMENVWCEATAATGSVRARSRLHKDAPTGSLQSLVKVPETQSDLLDQTTNWFDQLQPEHQEETTTTGWLQWKLWHVWIYLEKQETEAAGTSNGDGGDGRHQLSLPVVTLPSWASFLGLLQPQRPPASPGPRGPG